MRRANLLPPPDATPYHLLEPAVVKDITATLGRLGYETLCVGQRKARGSGTTTGYPDLSVRRGGWPKGLCCLLEAKTEAGELRTEQQDLHERGWSFVVRSPREALLAIRVCEMAMGEVGAAERIERALKTMGGGL
jgi:hypothetical protein